MENLIAYYNELLNEYTALIQELEAEQKEFLKQHPGAPGVPYAAFNSRFFDTDEIARLNNAMGSDYHKGKHRLKNVFYRFLAEYEKSSEEVRQQFEDQKEKSTYQGYLDLLYLPREKPSFIMESRPYVSKVPFIPWLEGDLKHLRFLESQLKHPVQPRSRNFNRQYSKYISDKKTFDEKSASIDRRKKEISDLIEMYKGLLNS